MRSIEFYKKYAFILAGIISVVLVVFVILKANTAAFTHDESFTYLRYPQDSFRDIISFKQCFSNNHILNSLLIKYSVMGFGVSELTIRLPNILILLVYLSYTFLLLKKENLVIFISFFILLSCNIHFDDMFALARGYGLSYAFMIMSLYHFIRSFHRNSNKNLILFHLAAMLAILSHFTLLTFYLSMLFIYNVIKFSEARSNDKVPFQFFKWNRVNIISFVLVFLVLKGPIQRVLEFNVMESGSTSFYDGTIQHLIYSLFNYMPISDNLMVFMKIIFTLLVLVPFAIIIKKIVQKDSDFIKNCKNLITSNLLFVLMCLAIILQHVLLGNDYPNARFVLFLMPLFMLQVGFFISFLFSFYSTQKRMLLNGVLTLFALASLINILKNNQIDYFMEWPYEQNSKDLIALIESEHEKYPDTQINLGLSQWIFEPTLNFYREINELDWLDQIDRDGFNEDRNYMFGFKVDFDLKSENKYVVVDEFDETGTVLVRLSH